VKETNEDLSCVIKRTLTNLCYRFAKATPVDAFSCPVCYGEGENALQDCDDKTNYVVCKGDDPVCYTQSNKEGDFVGRGCYSREYYYKKKDRCERKGTCVIAMCETSGCTAELPAKGRMRFFFNLVENGAVWELACFTRSENRGVDGSRLMHRQYRCAVFVGKKFFDKLISILK